MVKLIVSWPLFAEMQQASLEAEMRGSDPALAAWKKTGLPFPDGVFPEIEIIAVENAETKLIGGTSRPLDASGVWG